MPRQGDEQPVRYEITPGVYRFRWRDGTEVSKQEADAMGLENPSDPEHWFDSIGAGLGISPKKIGPAAPGANLETSYADAQRGGLEALLGQLQQQASTGNGSWENALKAATERSKATAQALGQSNPDVDYGSAVTNIGNAQAGAEQRAVGQGNILREQSKMAAQNQLGDLLGSMGGSDIEQANAQARTRQQVGATNQALIDEAQKNEQQLQGGISQMAGPFGSKGGVVPGKPRVFGDDEKNDTVPAVLSPGEVVLPRSIAHDPEAAAAFVKALNAQKQTPGQIVEKMADGGETGIGQWSTDEYGAGNQVLSFVAPGVGGMAGYGSLRGKAGAGAPTVDNGGALDTKNFEKTRAARNQLGVMLRERAAGGGPSIAPQMTTNANDAAIAAAMQSRGAPAGAAVSGATEMAQSGAGEAAAQKAREQSAGQTGAAAVGAQARGQELSLAMAQQQAGWANTMQNLGLSLANQAALRNMFSGAGQSLTAASGAGRGKPGAWDESSPDFGDPSTQTNDLGDQGGDEAWDESVPDTPDTSGQTNDLGGFAHGGRVEGKYPSMPQPKDRSTTKLRIGDVTLETDSERKAREYEEETGMKKPAERAKAGEKQTLAQQLAEFARKHLTAGASGMAEGGTVPASFQPSPTQPWLFGMPPTNAVRPGELPPELAAIAASAPPPPQSRYAPPQGPTSAVPLTSAEQSISREMGAPQTVAHDDAVKAQQDRAAAERLGIKRGPGSSDSETPPIGPPPTESRPIATGVRPPPAHTLEQGFITNQAQLANEAMGEAAQQEARNEGEAARAEAAAAESGERDLRMAREKARLNTQSALTKWQAAQDEMAKVDTNIDPGRFWAERTTGQKILGIIGLALGAAGTGPDGINKAAVMLNQAIDRDVEAQKARFEASLRKAGAKAAAAQTYYGMAREAGLDEIAAAHAAKAAGLEAVSLKFKQTGALTKEARAKAAMLGTASLIDQAKLDKQMKVEESTADFQQKNVALGIQAMAAGAKPQLGSAERIKIADEVNTAALNIRTEAERLKSLINQYGTDENQITGPGVAKDMDLLSDSLATTMAKMQDPATGVRDPEMARWSANVFRRGYAQTKADALAGLDNIIKAAESRRQNALRVRGMK